MIRGGSSAWEEFGDDWGGELRMSRQVVFRGEKLDLDFNIPDGGVGDQSPIPQ